MMFSKLKQEIIKIVQSVQGVRSVDIKIGKNYYKINIAHNYELESPHNEMLDDDTKLKWK